MKFRKVRLCDLCSIVTDYVANGSFKTLADKVKYLNEGYARVIRLVDYNNKYSKKDSIWVSKESYEFLKKSKLYGGEIVLTNVGANLGTVFIAPQLEYPTTLGPNAIMIKTNENDKYLYYWLKSKNGQNTIKSIVTGSAMPKFNKTDLKNIEIAIPCIEDQDKIVEILSNIDKKIELNNQTNDNLLELIKKLYIEKIKNNNDINFEEKNLDEFCNIFTGKKNANASEENGQYKFFTCAPEPLSINSYIYDGPAVIVAGNGAYTGRTNFYNGKFDLYQRTYGITTNNDYIYLFYAMIYTDLQNDIMGGTHGSAIPYIVMNDIAKFKVKYNKELFDELSQKIKVLLLKIKSNEAQNETLEQLRDTLLPKLMNGEMNLDNIKI